MGKVFLSHKQQFAKQAKELSTALKTGVPGATVFQSEDIDKGEDWREMIDSELDEAKCFVLLYTSPNWTGHGVSTKRVSSCARGIKLAASTQKTSNCPVGLQIFRIQRQTRMISGSGWKAISSARSDLAAQPSRP